MARPTDPLPPHRPASAPHAVDSVRPATPLASGLFRPATPAGPGPLGQPQAQRMAQPRKGDDPSRLLPWLRGNNPTFRTISDEAAATLFSLAALRTDMRGKVLTKHDDPVPQLFIVVEGTLVVRVNRGKLVRELFSYGAGGVAGLLALVDPAPAPYEIVVASQQCQYIAIDARRLQQYTAAFHPVSMQLLAVFTPTLIEHLRELDLRVGKLAVRKNATMAGSGQTFRRDDR